MSHTRLVSIASGAVAAVALMACFLSAGAGAEPAPQAPQLAAASPVSASGESSGVTVPYKATVSGPVHPEYYESYCAMNVAMWLTHPPATGESLTTCYWPVDYIRQLVNLYRGRWWGEQGLASRADVSEQTASQAVQATWECKGAGTYTYTVKAYGTVEWSGETSTADAYDDARFNC